jgi:hypothetical protein
VTGDGHAATAEHVSSLARLLLAVDEAEMNEAETKEEAMPPTMNGPMVLAVA